MNERRSIEFVVEGKPVTQGSKNPIVPTYKDGDPVRRHKASCPAFADKDLARSGFRCRCPIMVNVLDDNDKDLEAWREQVAWHAKAARRSAPLLDGLLIGVFEFVMRRPKSHYGTGRNAELLKDSAPAAPGNRPDGVKLARAVEDAMTNIVYTDDSLIVTHVISKRYCDRLEAPHVRVRVIECRAQTVGDLVAMGKLSMPRAEEVAGQLDLLDELAAEQVAA
jgi:Holliday junction resolvase RusA-like endonuclease